LIRSLGDERPDHASIAIWGDPADGTPNCRIRPDDLPEYCGGTASALI
jgi:hypothetical protein